MKKPMEWVYVCFDLSNSHEGKVYAWVGEDDAVDRLYQSHKFGNGRYSRLSEAVALPKVMFASWSVVTRYNHVAYMRYGEP